MSARVVAAVTDGDLARARGLLEEYAASLDFALDFQDFTAELAAFPGDYAPPRGRVLLAEADGEAVGCVCLRPLAGDACEMKRLYLKPAWRGRGLGRRLAAALLDEARGLGYARMRLDTVAAMTAANALYRALGFRAIPPYRHNPLPDALFFERDL
ncbi:MAG: GNAT family N-acetyltransferase [Candidatus Krumholzibacteriota bacterium]|nr:GNAT family N-acetyltransferase [Candidatus Krumholzibacteriota bacterium]